MSDDVVSGGLVRKPPSAKNVRAMLLEVGAPEISEEDFARLYKGRMIEVLGLVALNVVGRNRVASARTAIQQFREASNARKPRVEDVIDPPFTSARQAESSFRNARASLTAMRTSREEQLQAISNIEREESELQGILEEKRRTALLLSVLEQKEKIRKDRFTEMARLLEELRQKTTGMKITRSLDDLQPRKLETLRKPQRAEHTRDTLSSLQAYTLRVSRLSQRAQDISSPSQVKEAEQHLLQAVAVSLSSTADDEKVRSVFQALCATGKSQAELSAQYQSPLPAELEKVENIQELIMRVRAKEDELQGIVDHSSALTMACAQSLQTITNFANETSPALRDALREENNNAQGHVDVLRLSVMNRNDPSAVQTPSGTDNLSRGQSFEAVLASIRRKATEAQEAEEFLRATESLIALEPANRIRHESLIENYAKEEIELSERVRKLLERKAKKTDAGHLLIQDIERLVAEVGIISGGHI